MHPDLIDLFLRPRQGQAVLLDRAELGRGLGADGSEQVAGAVRPRGPRGRVNFSLPVSSPHSISLQMPSSR